MLKQLGPFFLTGIALEILWVTLGNLGPLRERHLAFLTVILCSFGLCVWSYLQLRIVDRKSLILVLAFGLLFRLTVLPSAPHQSEDVYRYLWDARVASSGIDPFAYEPRAPQLRELRNEIYPLLNSKPYITAYPPVSQLLFRATYAIFGESMIPMKAVFGILEFGAVILACYLLRLLNRSPQTIFLLAWNPFFIFEFWHSGHSDSAMMFFALLSVILLHQSRNALAFAGFACAVMSKLHPALWFPLYLRLAGWKAAAAGLITGTLLLAVYFTPATLLGYLSSLRLYIRLFEFNASIHYLLRWIGRVFYNESWDQLTGPYLALLLALVTIVICWRFPLRSSSDLLHAGFWIMTADLCLATTVHPWYLSWAALALPVFPYAFMVYWTGASFLSYIAYAYRPVFEPTWVLMVQYLPMYALMAWEIARRRPLLLSRTETMK